MAKPSCPNCRKLQRRVAELEALVRDLQTRLGLNATNSSLPPSANPPAAPKPVFKEPTGQKPGGQPGHSPQQRLRLPPERVQHMVRHLPPVCDRCQATLPFEPGPNDPAPTWHQVAELPAVAAVQAEPVKHADETGWKQAGRLCWLWTAVTSGVACFLVHAGRGAAHRQGLTAPKLLTTE